MTPFSTNFSTECPYFRSPVGIYVRHFHIRVPPDYVGVSRVWIFDILARLSINRRNKKESKKENQEKK